MLHQEVFSGLRVGETLERCSSWNESERQTLLDANVDAKIFGERTLEWVGEIR